MKAGCPRTLSSFMNRFRRRSTSSLSTTHNISTCRSQSWAPQRVLATLRTGGAGKGTGAGAHSWTPGQCCPERRWWCCPWSRRLLLVGTLVLGGRSARRKSACLLTVSLACLLAVPLQWAHEVWGSSSGGMVVLVVVVLRGVPELGRQDKFRCQKELTSGEGVGRRPGTPSKVVASPALPRSSPSGWRRPVRCGAWTRPAPGHRRSSPAQPKHAALASASV